MHTFVSFNMCLSTDIVRLNKYYIVISSDKDRSWGRLQIERTLSR